MEPASYAPAADCVRHLVYHSHDGDDDDDGGDGDDDALEASFRLGEARRGGGNWGRRRLDFGLHHHHQSAI